MAVHWPVGGLFHPPRRLLALSLAFVLLMGLGGLSQRAASQTAAEKHYLYIAEDGAVEVFDIDNGHRFLRNIPIRDYSNPRGMRASAVTQRLYVSYKSSPQGPSLVALDLTNDRILWKKPFPPDADALSITPDGSTIYMASGEATDSDYFFVIDAATGTIKDHIHIHPGTHNTIVNLTGTKVYMTSLDYNYLHVVDVKTNQTLQKVGPFAAGIRPFTINGKETLAFVNVNGLQGFEVADLTTGRVIHRVEVQGFPYPPNPVARLLAKLTAFFFSRSGVLDPSHGVGLTPDEREVWVAGATKYVHVFDATVMPPWQVASIPVKAIPKWIGFSLDGRYMYPGTGDVIDVQARRVVGRIASSKRQLQIDFVNGVAVRANDIYGVGKVAKTQ